MQRLDGPREKILGEWSSESVLDTTYDNGYRMILTAYERRAYNEDRTYDDEWHTLIKLEISFRDGPVRMYYYIHGNSKNSWSADNGLYVDSNMTTSFKDEVAPGNAKQTRICKLVKCDITVYPIFRESTTLKSSRCFKKHTMLMDNHGKKLVMKRRKSFIK